MDEKGLKKFTSNELADFDGTLGRPTYLVFKGKVYDVSNSQLWINGEHMNIHKSREELEKTIATAPHGAEVLQRFPVVGVVEEKEETFHKPAVVPYTPENLEKCICKDCPSYPTLCRGELLYCSPKVGGSKCDIKANWCTCNVCPVYSEYHLKGLYFCDKEEIGREGVMMRKEGSREEDWFYNMVADIKRVSYSGESIVASMGSKKRMPFSFDDLHFVPGQLYKIPRDVEEEVETEVVIGPNAKKPLKVSTPIMISGMSFGAVSKNVKYVIAQTAKKLQIAFNSGEGGVLPEDIQYGKGYYIIQYASGRYGSDEATLKQGDCIEVRFGQGAYPGKGSYLPAEKINPEIAKIRGLKPGEAAHEPAHHPDITKPEDLKKKVDWLRDITGGVPIGSKIGCGNIEKDVEILVDSGVDYIAMDGFGGGTGATNLFVRENDGIPIIVALPRAVKKLKELGVKEDISVIAAGGLRTSADFAKCLALGADAVYTATAALIAINCEQYRICHTGLCPTGVTTQNPVLTKQIDVPEGIRRLTNFINVTTNEMKLLTRIVGKTSFKSLNTGDLVSLNKDLSEVTGVKWFGEAS
jgi:glutamate synthase domain-containing protein 2/predicted heme/steroid binding protein